MAILLIKKPFQISFMMICIPVDILSENKCHAIDKTQILLCFESTLVASLKICPHLIETNSFTLWWFTSFCMKNTEEKGFLCLKQIFDIFSHENC